MNLSLRALTVRQPWAQAIAEAADRPHDAKTIENRAAGFPKTYRGPLLIHAGAAWSHHGIRDPRIRRLFNVAEHDIDLTAPWETFPTAAVIAICDVADIHPASNCCAPWGEETYQPANPEDRPPGQVTHLVLEHVTRLRPIPAKGRLGLWQPDPDLHLEVAHALAEQCTWDPDAAHRLAERGDAGQLWAAVRPEETHHGR